MMTGPQETDRKISEVFLEFSEPLWVREGRKATRIEIERALKIAWLAWNSAVTDAIRGEEEALGRLRANLADTPEVLRVCELLLRRKRQLYSDDLRLVINYQIIDDDGEWRLQVKAAST
jgi:hypothetical protein